MTCRVSHTIKHKLRLCRLTDRLTWQGVRVLKRVIIDIADTGGVRGVRMIVF